MRAQSAPRPDMPSALFSGGFPDDGEMGGRQTVPEAAPALVLTQPGYSSWMT
jgi:hypothetical protein